MLAMGKCLIKNKRGFAHRGFFYRLILCAFAGMLMGVAAVLFIAGGYGADPMSTLLQGMSQTLQLSIDTCNNLLSFTFVLTAFLIDRKQIHAGTVVFPLVTTITMWILTPLPYHVIRWILDGSMLLTGIMMQGTFGVVTIINLLVLGKLITVTGYLMDSLYRLRGPIKKEEEISL